MSMSTERLRSPFRVGEVVRTETGAYQILEEFKGGGRARTFLARVVRRPHNRGWVLPKALRKEAGVVIKIARIDPARDPVGMEEFVRIVNTSLEQEISVTNRLHDLECVARTIDSGARPAHLQNWTPVHLTFIVQEYADGLRLDEYMKKWPRGISSARAWLRLARDLATAVKEFHQRGICHQDIWPHNIILLGNKPVFIDFGEAALRHATNLPYGPRRPHPHAYMAPEGRGVDRFASRRADLYSLGGVLYFLAVGEDPPTTLPKGLDSLKTYVMGLLKKKNQALVSQNWGVADITARCLRHDRNRRVRNAEALLQEIRTFGLDSPTDLAGTLKRVRRLGSELRRRDDHLFEKMAAVELRQVECRMQDMLQGILDISGDHEAIVSGLTQYLSVLRQGDEYLAVTVPRFWFTGNLGINGRYLAMNRQIAMGGVHVRRLFLLTKADRSDARVRKILSAHRDVCREVIASRKSTMDVRYREVTPGERKAAVQQGDHLGIWIKKGAAMEIVPVYDADSITTIRLRSVSDPPAVLRKKLDDWELADPLEKWFGKEPRGTVTRRKPR
ncbi:MAG TPA: protein kinase [Terriglobia bacterium]|nr:protein kinase [Terriglobia bacterium]